MTSRRPAFTNDSWWLTAVNTRGLFDCPGPGAHERTPANWYVPFAFSHTSGSPALPKHVSSLHKTRARHYSTVGVVLMDELMYYVLLYKCVVLRVF